MLSLLVSVVRNPLGKIVRNGKCALPCQHCQCFLPFFFQRCLVFCSGRKGILSSRHLASGIKELINYYQCVWFDDNKDALTWVAHSNIWPINVCLHKDLHDRHVLYDTAVLSVCVHFIAVVMCSWMCLQETVAFILNQSECGVLVCSASSLPPFLSLAAAGRCSHLQHIIVMDLNEVHPFSHTPTAC